jgi:transcriptional regulator with XRE-family HTH domain
MNSGGQLDTNRKADLLQELENREYRRGFVEGLAKDTIAFQIRQLRKSKDWEQRDLARELGNPKLQPMISRYENPDYGRYSITTLLELADVFDLALVVRFAPISELVEWDWQSTAQTLAPASYAQDKRLSLLAKRIEKPNASMGDLANLGSMGERAKRDEVSPAFGKPPTSQAADNGAVA